MTDTDNDHDGLLDDDPALDCILFEEMRRDDQPGRGGCFGLIVVFLTPVLPLALLLAIA